jgi:hypothetical protein
MTQFGEPGDVDPFSELLRRNLVDIISWAERQNPRGHQVLIGPSEIGDPCDRRLGYRMAQVPAANADFDPWAAIMGTAVHSWLQDAVNRWMLATSSTSWLTETTLSMNDFVEGHADLYWREEQTVVDWKTQGPTVFKKTKENGPARGYVIQAHVYGYGFEQAGLPVKKVALAFLSRAGWLKDMYVWSQDYDRSVAEQAFQRMYVIAQKVMDLGISKESNSHRWEQMDAAPSNTCGFCPWYAPWKDGDQGADHHGCPGR